jgi:hypothetical protein
LRGGGFGRGCGIEWRLRRTYLSEELPALRMSTDFAIAATQKDARGSVAPLGETTPCPGNAPCGRLSRSARFSSIFRQKIYHPSGLDHLLEMDGLKCRLNKYRSLCLAVATPIRMYITVLVCRNCACLQHAAQ